MEHRSDVINLRLADLEAPQRDEIKQAIREIAALSLKRTAAWDEEQSEERQAS
jgi:hypothetical protein